MSSHTATHLFPFVMLLTCLTGQEGFPSTHTAVHGLACLERLLLLRELEYERERRVKQGLEVPSTTDWEELMRAMFASEDGQMQRSKHTAIRGGLLHRRDADAHFSSDLPDSFSPMQLLIC